MLNIKDIQERLKRNPEPQEIKDIRNNILNSFNRLEFIEEGHKYYLHHDDGTIESLKSVSETCHQFEQENDWETITKNYAEKHNMTVEQVKRMWHENNIKATNNGTSTHLYGEQMMYFVMGYPEKICDVIKPQYEDGYLIPYSKKQEAIMKYYEDLIKIDEIYPVIPETQIYTGVNDTLHLEHNYAGTFDMLFTMKINGEWKLMIHDYKTNCSLSSSYNQSKGITMKAPFDDLIDEAKSHYILQLSCYEMGLRQLGYDVIDRRLIHLKDDGTYDKIALPSVVDRLKKVL